MRWPQWNKKFNQYEDYNKHSTLWYFVVQIISCISCFVWFYACSWEYLSQTACIYWPNNCSPLVILALALCGWPLLGHYWFSIGNCDIGFTSTPNNYIIEGLHDAIRTYTRTILPRCLVSFCMARYREKQQKTKERFINFAERFKISTKCVC